MITLQVQREDDSIEGKNRYILEFQDEKYTWFMFLRDEVYHDPVMFSSWMKSLVSDLQIKNKKRS